MSLTSRFLSADGTVHAATHVLLDPDHDDPVMERLYGAYRNDPECRCDDPTICWRCDVAAVWFAFDPCAWDATCPHCYQGHIRGTDIDGNEVDEACGTCRGSGTVDGVPIQLVGVGSVLREDCADGLVQYWLVTARRLGDWKVVRLAPRPSGRVEVVPFRWLDEGPTSWRVERAVPPSDATLETP